MLDPKGLAKYFDILTRYAKYGRTNSVTGELFKQ